MATEPTARLEARLPVSVHAALKQAAELEGRTLSDFVISAAYRAACSTIEAQTLIRLSAEDQQRFAEALLSPPIPNETLKRAARRHLEHVEVR